VGVFDVIRDFLERGGDVLWVIFAVTLFLWTLIYERYLFFRRAFPRLEQARVAEWLARADKSSWFAHRIREAMISETSAALNKNIPLIKTLVSACPLLGLLGTVTGMIAVFDVMAITGTSNARLMASGISMATIPTMAGMIAALSGLYFGTRLEKKAKNYKEKFAEELPFH
jgi:biopolymer transport protein ExbB